MLLFTLLSQVVSWHTTTHKREGVPNANESDLDEQFKKYQELFALPPDRLKEITKRFVEVLKAGLQEEGQTVVSRQLLRSRDDADIHSLSFYSRCSRRTSLAGRVVKRRAHI